MLKVLVYGNRVRTNKKKKELLAFWLCKMRVGQNITFFLLFFYCAIFKFYIYRNKTVANSSCEAAEAHGVVQLETHH